MLFLSITHSIPAINPFPRTSPTIGISFNAKIIKKDDKELNLEIWDTAGTEVYHSLSKLYYRETDFILLCFDLSEKSTFISLYNWIDDIKNYCSNDKVIIYILGNKSDLEHEVSKNEIEEFCQKNNVKYIETSSKNNSISNLLELILEDYKIPIINESVSLSLVKNEQDTIEKYKSRFSLC